MDFIIDKPQPYGINRLNTRSLGHERFEFGVDGLRIAVQSRRRYVLPGDVFVRSIFGKGQLMRYIKKLTGESEMTDLVFERFQSQSYVSFGDDWIRLYRGYPVQKDLTRQDLIRVGRGGAQYAAAHQKENGSFLYYYDAAKNSYRDHEHSKRDPVTNPYYNILRHSGGGDEVGLRSEYPRHAPVHHLF